MNVKKNILSLVCTVLLCMTLLFVTGCAKKKVEPPLDTTGNSSGTFSSSENPDFNYPPADSADGYSESNIGSEERLDTDVADYSNSGGLTVNSGIDEAEQSDAYKREHGRCSAGLNPVYYNFDESGIRPDMINRIEGNAEFMKQMPAAKIVIEGNSDERGTNEYNLALAQRRAIKAKEYLVNLGIAPSRIRTVSYGEERPLFTGQDESAYEMNRRSDFVLE